MKHLPLSDDSPDEGLVNLTPLIDVVFVVLIMFIIIAPLIEIDRIELAQGRPIKQTTPVQERAISIHVQSDNTIVINKKKIPVKELKQVIAELAKSYPHHIPQVYHDKRASFGTYQLIKTTLEEGGFEKMDIILKNE